jgi:hypothetical protein
MPAKRKTIVLLTSPLSNSERARTKKNAQQPATKSPTQTQPQKSIRFTPKNLVKILSTDVSQQRNWFVPAADCASLPTFLSPSKKFLIAADRRFSAQAGRRPSPWTCSALLYRLARRLRFLGTCRSGRLKKWSLTDASSYGNFLAIREPDNESNLNRCPYRYRIADDERMRYDSKSSER